LYVQTNFVKIGARFEDKGIIMRQATVVGNWKMHGSIESVDTLLQQLVESLNGLQQIKIAVCPPFVFLDRARKILGTSSIALGAQNLCEQVQGAFTGEVSGIMLKEFGCQYVIIGHSERRALYGETDAVVASKIAVALEQGLQPILCVGETLAQREANETLAVINNQLSAVIEKVGVKVFSEVVIAYEPVWAIGTGKTATPEQAQKVHQHIRDYFRVSDNEIAEKLAILYGGSVKSQNAVELFKQPDIDGGLIGGASLDAKEFELICRAIE